MFRLVVTAFEKDIACAPVPLNVVVPVLVKLPLCVRSPLIVSVPVPAVSVPVEAMVKSPFTVIFEAAIV